MPVFDIQRHVGSNHDAFVYRYVDTTYDFFVESNRIDFFNSHIDKYCVASNSDFVDESIFQFLGVGVVDSQIDDYVYSTTVHKFVFLISGYNNVRSNSRHHHKYNSNPVVDVWRGWRCCRFAVPVVVVEGATPAPPPITNALAAKAALVAHVGAMLCVRVK